MNPRFSALEIVSSRSSPIYVHSHAKIDSERFGSLVFSRTIMEKMFSKEIFMNIHNAMEGLEKIRPEFAETIAIGMKEWAIKHGATHYCHWFQPLTGATAEKHDSFIEWKTSDRVIEMFRGKQLIQGEPDASSFPSGGLRSTYEARGYTAWTVSSPAFLWRGGDGLTLCIPSIFYSWTGDTLDTKIPLLKSERKLGDAMMRLLALTKTPASYCFSTVGLEQEYFVIDKAYRNLRPDLVLLGRTVFGSPPPKGQELEDHYFGTVKNRILAYMRDFEDAAIELGIPVKTRHNEVAPAQHEIAPIHEKTSIAIDHNILLMELMRQIASKHNLACLLHEKPFDGVNGSGKHCNWSISTDTGINLLDPTDSPENSLNFLILLTAILDAVHEHATLLRCSVGSAGNDYRLGANEAPPAIISVFLGEALEELLNNIETKGAHQTASKSKHDLGLPVIPELPKDNTDRNRTSPFAFTGNKFEYRAAGSSSSAAFPITILNVIVAQSLNKILDEVEQVLEKKDHLTQAQVTESALPVIVKSLKRSKKIRYSGDNYSEEWHKEAAERGLPIYNQSLYSYSVLKAPQTIEAFKDVLSIAELHSRYEIMVENYCKTVNIQANLMLDMFKTQILPACIDYQAKAAKSILRVQQTGLSASAQQIKLLDRLTKAIDQAIGCATELEQLKNKIANHPLEERGKGFCDLINPICAELRKTVDYLETIVDDSLWPLPKYRELLFLV